MAPKMAINLNVGLGDVWLWIRSEDNNLKTYGTTKPSENVTDTHIISQSGRSFSVQLEIPQCLGDQGLRIYIDGAKCYSLLMRRDLLSRVESIDGVRIGPDTCKRFVFADIVTDHMDESEYPETFLKNLGSIRLVLFPVNVKETSPNDSVPSEDRARAILPGEQNLGERSKIFGSHLTRLGEVAPFRSIPKYKHKCGKIPGAVRAEVTFRYAPIDILQAREIVPVERAKVPAVVKSKRPVPCPEIKVETALAEEDTCVGTEDTQVEVKPEPAPVKMKSKIKTFNPGKKRPRVSDSSLSENSCAGFTRGEKILFRELKDRIKANRAKKTARKRVKLEKPEKSSKRGAVDVIVVSE